jgi:hypothetical protein
MNASDVATACSGRPVGKMAHSHSRLPAPRQAKRQVNGAIVTARTLGGLIQSFFG